MAAKKGQSYDVRYINVELLLECPCLLRPAQLQPEPVDGDVGEHQLLSEVGDLFPHFRPAGVERSLRPPPPLLEIRLVLVGVQSHWPRCRQERVDVLCGFLVEDEFELEYFIHSVDYSN